MIRLGHLPPQFARSQSIRRIFAGETTPVFIHEETGHQRCLAVNAGTGLARQIDHPAEMRQLSADRRCHPDSVAGVGRRRRADRIGVVIILIWTQRLAHFLIVINAGCRDDHALIRLDRDGFAFRYRFRADDLAVFNDQLGRFCVIHKFNAALLRRVMNRRKHPGSSDGCSMNPVGIIALIRHRHMSGTGDVGEFQAQTFQPFDMSRRTSCHVLNQFLVQRALALFQIILRMFFRRIVLIARQFFLSRGAGSLDNPAGTDRRAAEAFRFFQNQRFRAGLGRFITCAHTRAARA